jgi:RNA polymerase sigma-70 factor (ECF subfamily)
MKDSYFIALGLVGNHDDALELSQEAFYRAYSNIKRLHPGRKFFPWFYQILRNLCFSHLRKSRHRKTSSLPQIEGEELTAAEGSWFNPEVVSERNELKDHVWDAIGQLSEKHREVIILRHFQNLSYDEIANNLFCSKGTVMSRLYHARKQLKEILGKRKGGQLS